MLIKDAEPSPLLCYKCSPPFHPSVFSHFLFSIPFSYAVSLPPHLSHILTQLHTSSPSYPGTHYSTVHITLPAFNADSYFLSQQQLRPLPSCPPPPHHLTPTTTETLSIFSLVLSLTETLHMAAALICHCVKRVLNRTRGETFSKVEHSSGLLFSSSAVFF